MAKKRAGGINKSEEVRKYFGEHPDAGPKQVIEAMKERGITVSTSLVTLTKRKRQEQAGGRKTIARRKKARRSIAAQPTTTRQATDGDLSAKDLFEAKQLADQLGGIRQARQALEMLEKLQ